MDEKSCQKGAGNSIVSSWRWCLKFHLCAASASSAALRFTLSTGAFTAEPQRTRSLRREYFKLRHHPSLLISFYSALRAGSNGERKAARVATSDAVAPESRTASSNRPSEKLGS